MAEATQMISEKEKELVGKQGVCKYDGSCYYKGTEGIPLCYFSKNCSSRRP